MAPIGGTISTVNQTGSFPIGLRVWIQEGFVHLVMISSVTSWCSAVLNREYSQSTESLLSLST